MAIREISLSKDEKSIDKVNQALFESEERYRLLIENAPLGIITFDTTGRIIDGNNMLLKILGSPSIEQTKLINVLTFPPMVEAGISADLKKCIETGEKGVYEHPYTTKWGKKVYLRYHITPIRDLNGNITGAQAIVEDMTDYKKMEEELLKNRTLDSISILAGGIAHDFNNILTAILGYISLAKIYINPENKGYEKLNEAEKATLMARDLAQKLLTFSKGGVPIKKLASLQEILENSVKNKLFNTRFTYQFYIPQDLYCVEVDESQITQVIQNIINNSEEAMPHGGTIKISANNVTISNEIPSLPPGEYVRVTIEDEGVGIPEENIPKIFDPYFTTKDKNIGFGLTIAYSIIKNHNGYITVNSKVGEGTIFYIYIPAYSKSRLEYEDKAKEKLKVNRILVMDDERIICEVASEILKNIGYEVECAKDGNEALELYKFAKEKGKPFDAIIMDLRVPGGIGGKESLQNIIKIDPNVKAIVSSGYSNDPVMANFKEYGFSAALKKPYGIKEIKSVLKEIFG